VNLRRRLTGAGHGQLPRALEWQLEREVDAARPSRQRRLDPVLAVRGPQHEQVGFLSESLQLVEQLEEHAVTSRRYHPSEPPSRD
jgi:hypothetical protein